MLAKVYVTPKKGVLDPQGKAVAQGLRTLGFSEVGDVRIGKYVEIRLDGRTADAERRIREMCEKLLANGVIEEFRFEVET
ncbi:MAG: phosphoribosylformylglycinamidine synthase subunit PurS [Candidatus Binatia bacterium]